MTDEWYLDNTPEKRRLRWAAEANDFSLAQAQRASEKIGTAAIHGSFPKTCANWPEGEPVSSFKTPWISPQFEGPTFGERLTRLEAAIERLEIRLRNHIWAEKPRSIE